jgi:hypothetical protein
LFESFDPLHLHLRTPNPVIFDKHELGVIELIPVPEHGVIDVIMPAEEPFFARDNALIESLKSFGDDLATFEASFDPSSEATADKTLSLEPATPDETPPPEEITPHEAPPPEEITPDEAPPPEEATSPETAASSVHPETTASEPPELSGDGRDKPPPVIGPPPMKEKFLLRNSIVSLLCFVTVVAILVVTVLTHTTYLSFIIFVPVIAVVTLYRRAYKRRMQQLAAAVIDEAEYVKQHYPEAYRAYYKEAQSALIDHGVGNFVASLPAR